MVILPDPEANVRPGSPASHRPPLFLDDPVLVNVVDLEESQLKACLIFRPLIGRRAGAVVETLSSDLSIEIPISANSASPLFYSFSFVNTLLGLLLV